MISLNHLIFDIKNIAYGGTQSDDTSVSDRQVAYWVNQLRALLVRNELSSTRTIPDIFVQHIECINLECIDPVECCEESSDERMMRSTQKVPLTIQRGGKNTILAVSSIDKKVGFSETSYFRQRTSKNNKFTGSRPRWFIKDEYLYLINSKLIDRVSISGIFEDPTEVIEFNTCEGVPCFTWDSKYPVTPNMAKTITDIILKDRLGITLSAPTDDSNDSTSKTEPVNE